MSRTTSKQSFSDFIFREEARERSGNVCKKCRMTNYKHLQIFGIPLTIHHKNKQADNFDGIYDFNNVEVLCINCHKRVHLFDEKFRKQKV